MSDKPPRTPPGLGPAGKRLWRSITSVWDLDQRETALLQHACETADLIDDLKALLAAEGLVTVGSQGQPRLSAVVTEIRQQRVVLDRLLNSLSLPSDEPRLSRRHQLAAGRRWGTA